MNKAFWNDPNNSNQMHEVLRWLRRNKIDTENDTWSLDELRRRIYLFHNGMRKLNAHWDKIDRLYYNHAAEKKFREVRSNFIDQIFAKSNVNELIQ